MALYPGKEDCSEGLAKELHDFFKKSKESGGMGAKDFVEIPVIDPKTGQDTGEVELWEDTLLKRLCYNLSKIILDHIKKNIEIHGVEVKIKGVETGVTGDCTVRINGIDYSGSISGNGKQNNEPIAQQSNNGKELVK